MTESQETSSENDFSDSVPQEIVENRRNVCQNYQSDLQTVESSTAAVIAVLALYAAVFSNIGFSLNLRDFSKFGTYVISVGLIFWILSIFMAMVLDEILSGEITHLTALLNGHKYGEDLPSASSFNRNYYSSKFSYLVRLTKILSRSSPVLLLIGLTGLYENGAVLISVLIGTILVLAFAVIYPQYNSSGFIYRTVTMYGWKHSIVWALRVFFYTVKAPYQKARSFLSGTKDDELGDDEVDETKDDSHEDVFDVEEEPGAND